MKKNILLTLVFLLVCSFAQAGEITEEDLFVENGQKVNGYIEIKKDRIYINFAPDSEITENEEMIFLFDTLVFFGTIKIIQRNGLTRINIEKINKK